MDIKEFISKFEEKLTLNFQVTEVVYESFQKFSGDMNPLHTDESFAKQKGFRGRVMYGNILNGFISYFVGECLPTKNVIIHTQNIEFKNPFYLNDNLLFEALIDGYYESVNAVVFKFKFYNQIDKLVAKGNLQIGLI
ncbi:MAG: MaoC/PaaZ C-terminal domain-containing protein [Candidatus Saccharimonadaceae bacterium]